ncbi:MAG: glutaredoxin domain-containing protein [Xanthomonadales bacterium]|nr:glutaredoxin domain-containing protein [Xanthomonadales bacterium]
MTDEEMEISRSTPSFRFDVKAAGGPPPAKPPEVDAEAAAFVDRAVADAENPVAFFALEWCEFCWSVRKLFAKLGIPYRSFDLDSVSYQDDNRGGKIRAVLLDRLGTPTIPQIFIGGEYVGGATDLFAALRDGRLEQLLEKSGIEMAEVEPDFEPESLLPGWLHKR